MRPENYSDQDYQFYQQLVQRKILIQNLIKESANNPKGINNETAVETCIQKHNNSYNTNKLSLILNTASKKIIPDTYHDHCAAIVDKKLINHSHLDSMGHNAVLIDLQTLNYIFINLDRSQRTILQQHYEAACSFGSRRQIAKNFIDKINANPDMKNAPIETLVNQVMNDDLLKQAKDENHLVFAATFCFDHLNIEEGDERLEPMIIITNNWKNPSAYEGSDKHHYCNLADCKVEHRFKDIGGTSAIIFPKKSAYFFVGTYEQKMAASLLTDQSDQQQYRENQIAARDIYRALLAEGTAFRQIINEERILAHRRKARAAADKPLSCAKSPDTTLPVSMLYAEPPVYIPEPFTSADETVITFPSASDTLAPEPPAPAASISLLPAETTGRRLLTTFIPIQVSTAPEPLGSFITAPPVAADHNAPTIVPPRRPPTPPAKHVSMPTPVRVPPLAPTIASTSAPVRPSGTPPPLADPATTPTAIPAVGSATVPVAATMAGPITASTPSPVAGPIAGSAADPTATPATTPTTTPATASMTTSTAGPTTTSTAGPSAGSATTSMAGPSAGSATTSMAGPSAGSATSPMAAPMASSAADPTVGSATSPAAGPETGGAATEPPPADLPEPADGSDEPVQQTPTRHTTQFDLNFNLSMYGRKHQLYSISFRRVKDKLSDTRSAAGETFEVLGDKAKAFRATVASAVNRLTGKVGYSVNPHTGVGASAVAHDEINLTSEISTGTMPVPPDQLKTTVMSGFDTSDRDNPSDQMDHTNYLSSKRGIIPFKTTSFINATLHVLTSTITADLLTHANTRSQHSIGANEATEKYINALKDVINTLAYNPTAADDDEQYKTRIKCSQKTDGTDYREYLGTPVMATLLHAIMELPGNKGNKKNLKTIKSQADNPMSLLASTVSEPEKKRREDRRTPYPRLTPSNIKDRPDHFNIEPCDIGTLYFAFLESLSVWKTKESLDYKIELEVIRKIDLKNLIYTRIPSDKSTVSSSSNSNKFDPSVPIITLPISNKNPYKTSDLVYINKIDVSLDDQKTVEFISSLPCDIAYSAIPTITLPGINKTPYEDSRHSMSLQQELDAFLNTYHRESSFPLKSEYLRSAGVNDKIIDKLKKFKLLKNKNRTITNSRKKVVIKAHTSQLKLITINLPSPLLPIDENEKADYADYYRGLNASQQDSLLPGSKNLMYGKKTTEELFGNSELIIIQIKDNDTQTFKQVAFKLKAVIYRIGKLNHIKNYNLADIHHTALIKQTPDQNGNATWHYYNDSLFADLGDIPFLQAEKKAQNLDPGIEMDTCFPQFIVLEKDQVFDYDHDIYRFEFIDSDEENGRDRSLSSISSEPPQSPPEKPPEPQPRTIDSTLSALDNPQLTQATKATAQETHTYDSLPNPIKNEHTLKDEAFKAKAQPRYSNIPCIKATAAKVNGETIFHANNIKINSRRYLATQAPRPETINNFWSTVSASGAIVSVDLTNQVDRAGSKSCNFVPEKGQRLTGDITVINEGEHTMTMSSIKTRLGGQLVDTTFVISNLMVDNKKHVHIHYTGWPDMQSTPPAVLTSLTRLIRTFSSNPSIPVQINCSAGVGRTSTLILTDVLLHSEKEEDLHQLIHEMRTQRGEHCVQKADQYAALLRIQENKQVLKKLLDQ